MLRITLLLSAFTVATPTMAEDWLGFLGHDRHSVAPGANVPIQWGPDQNIAWKAVLPGRGPSSPIVVRDCVIVTGSAL